MEMGDALVQQQQQQQQRPPPSLHTPLLTCSSQREEEEFYTNQDANNNNDDTKLDQLLEKLQTLLTILGFNQSSIMGFVISWKGFLSIGVLLPVVILVVSQCEGCDKYQIEGFELYIVGSQACLAVVSLICMSHNLRKHGLKKFLFVDTRSSTAHHLYIRQIKDSLRLLLFWSLPCFILKVVREAFRIYYVHRDTWWLSTAILVGLVLCWSYLSTLSLTASILFHLVCNLQLLHFEDYSKLLQRETDVLVFIEEHIHLRYNLSKISHRFRIFLLLQFTVVIACQFVTLFQTTGYSGIITIVNGGDFAVSSLVQVVGIILSLHAATKISHRAQGITSLASRWHALATCTLPEASQLGVSNSVGNLEVVNPSNTLHINYSESDLESWDHVAMPTKTQLASYLSNYHRRQAFVMYLQNNPGGITLYVWTIDRGLINTIFFIELTLTTFVLGKTIVFSSK